MSIPALCEIIRGNGTSKLLYSTNLTLPQVAEITDALKENTSILEVVLANVDICNAGAQLFAEIISTNTTMRKLDLGYNKIDGSAMQAIGKALAVNTGLEEVKLHRQEKDMGPAIEEELGMLWATNVTLTRCYVTMHSRKFNGDNTRGEVRNKEIARRKEAGKDWLDLDPARKEEYLAQQDQLRKTEAEAAAKANAPISEKIASTGGPYTYKQLTSEREFWPDDVEISKRESYLSDDEFQTVFGMDKAAYEKVAGWKKSGLKKEKHLS